MKVKPLRTLVIGTLLLAATLAGGLTSCVGPPPPPHRVLGLPRPPLPPLPGTY